MNSQPAHLAPGAETYEQKRIRLRIPPGTTPGPRGSYASFTAANGLSVKVWVSWFVGMGWYFSVEVWNLDQKDAKGLYLCRDAPYDSQWNSFKGAQFWSCAEAGEQHARKLVALFSGQFPARLNPYSRVDGEYSDNAR